MNTEESIRHHQTLIRDQVRRLKKSLNNLLRLVTAQSLLIESFKETNRGTPPPFQGFAALVRRKVIDKFFLEVLGVIDSKTRRPAQAKPPQSPIGAVGNLSMKLREAKERSQITVTDRVIIKTILKQLDAEL